MSSLLLISISQILILVSIFLLTSVVQERIKKQEK